MKTFFYTALAMLAFAANSVLCRLALGDAQIDAASFTIVRLLAGAATLMLLLAVLPAGDGRVQQARGSWLSGFMLFVYALAFSYAYISLDTGTGALILFGAVQLTIIVVSFMQGNRLHYSEWAGLLLAFCGLVYLVLPGLTTPSASGFLLMAISGIAWGAYTLLGRQSLSPLRDTAFNFARGIPFVLLLLPLIMPSIELGSKGLVLALVSGAIASGLGYALWYAVLAQLSATLAAVVQLIVPVLAALGGVVFVGEDLSLRLLLAGVFILGGILLVVLGRGLFHAGTDRRTR